MGGGPHEDDIDEPMVERLGAFDLSISGDGEGALSALVMAALDAPSDARRNVDVPTLLARQPLDGAGCVARRGGKRWRWQGGGVPRPEALFERPWADRPVHFSVFPGRTTLPLMVSRGCSYGQCTFCAEGGSGGQRAAKDFEALNGLLEANPGSALYFQDSIFPSTREVRERLLPLLRDAGPPWGCQVYLPTLSHSFVELLVAHGCTYVYTGLESGSEALRQAVGKKGLRDARVTERFEWLAESGMRLGLSLMFGVIDLEGRLLETQATVESTVRLVEGLGARGLDVAGVYPNVMTVLPGTRLARALAARGTKLDFYRVPRTPAFAELEDGAVGHNFATLGLDSDGSLQRMVAEVSARLAAMRGLVATAAGVVGEEYR